MIRFYMLLSPFPSRALSRIFSVLQYIWQMLSVVDKGSSKYHFSTIHIYRDIWNHFRVKSSCHRPWWQLIKWEKKDARASSILLTQSQFFIVFVLSSTYQKIDFIDVSLFKCFITRWVMGTHYTPSKMSHRNAALPHTISFRVFPRTISSHLQTARAIKRNNFLLLHTFPITAPRGHLRKAQQAIWNAVTLQ